MNDARYRGYQISFSGKWTGPSEGRRPRRRAKARGASFRIVRSDTSSSKSLDRQPAERTTVNMSEQDVFRLNLLAAADEVTSTVARKQNDYGPHNINRSPFGPIEGLTTRLYDKVARLAHLTVRKTEPENESLRDTFLDIAGYGLIGLMVLDGTFPKDEG